MKKPAEMGFAFTDKGNMLMKDLLQPFAMELMYFIIEKTTDYHLQEQIAKMEGKDRTPISMELFTGWYNEFWQERSNDEYGPVHS
jgi:hypothetical protein